MTTHKQQQALDYLRSFIAKNDFSPSYDEITEALDLSSKSGAHRLVSALEERGYIYRLANKARSIRIVDDTPPVVQRSNFEIPFLGKVSDIAALNKRYS